MARFLAIVDYAKNFRRYFVIAQINSDLNEAVVTCSENRVATVMRGTRLKSARIIRTPRFDAGKPLMTAQNKLT